MTNPLGFWQKIWENEVSAACLEPPPWLVVHPTPSRQDRSIDALELTIHTHYINPAPPQTTPPHQPIPKFDVQCPSPCLLKLIAEGAVPPGRALVPGCGRGYDVTALASAGKHLSEII